MAGLLTTSRTPMRNEDYFNLRKGPLMQDYECQDFYNHSAYAFVACFGTDVTHLKMFYNVASLICWPDLSRIDLTF